MNFRTPCPLMLATAALALGIAPPVAAASKNAATIESICRAELAAKGYDKT